MDYHITGFSITDFGSKSRVPDTREIHSIRDFGINFAATFLGFSILSNLSCTTGFRKDCHFCHSSHRLDSKPEVNHISTRFGFLTQLVLILMAEGLIQLELYLQLVSR